MNPYDLFNAVSGLKVAVGVEDEAHFISEVSKHSSTDHRWRPHHLTKLWLDVDRGSGEEERRSRAEEREEVFPCGVRGRQSTFNARRR